MGFFFSLYCGCIFLARLIDHFIMLTTVPPSNYRQLRWMAFDWMWKV